MPFGDPHWGLVYTCPCYWAKRSKEPPWVGHSLEEFKPLPGTAEALKQTWCWAKGEIAFLTLSGVPGSGKTHLSRGAIMHMMMTEVHGSWRDVTETLELLKEGFGATDTPKFEERMLWLLQPEPMVLDDIGAEQPTDWTRATLPRIINVRKSHGYPTMFTTNHLPKTLAHRTDARIASRVFDRQDGVVVIMKGARDYRMKEKR